MFKKNKEELNKIIKDFTNNILLSVRASLRVTPYDTVWESAVYRGPIYTLAEMRWHSLQQRTAQERGS